MGVATKIFHPFRPGMYADSDSVDDCAEMLVEIKAEIDKMRACEAELRSCIGRLAPQQAKTERVSGERVQCKVVWPDDYWSQTELKQLWEEAPEFSKTFLRIATLAPNMREVKKLDAWNGSSEFEQHKQKLLRAWLKSTAPPTVTVERELIG